jgi:large repetitive protein
LLVSSGTSNLNQSITLTATISPVTVGPFNAAGTVTFLDGATPIGTVALSGNSAALTLSTLAAGTHSLSARYNGDTNFATSTSTTASHTVNQQSTTVSLTSSANPSVNGSPVTFTATVSPNAVGSFSATGTVTFMDGGSMLAVIALSNGSAQFGTPGLSSGAHNISAVYSGDGNFTGSSNSVSQTVVTFSDSDSATDAAKEILGSLFLGDSDGDGI